MWRGLRTWSERGAACASIVGCVCVYVCGTLPAGGGGSGSGGGGEGGVHSCAGTVLTGAGEREACERAGREQHSARTTCLAPPPASAPPASPLPPLASDIEPHFSQFSARDFPPGVAELPSSPVAPEH